MSPVSKHIAEVLRIVDPPNDPAQLPDWIRRVLIPSVIRLLEEHRHTHPQSIRGENRAKPYLNASAPSATEAGDGAIICVTDGAAGTQFRGAVGGAYVNLG